MIDTSVKALLTGETEVMLTPGYEGANIGTYIGFKHVNYLVEKAVIEHFRASGLPVGELYQRYGLGFDLVELESRLRGGLYVDDEALLRVRPATADDGSAFEFRVTMSVPRDGVRKKIVDARARAVLRRDEDERRMPDRTPTPPSLERFAVSELGPARPGPDVPGPDVPGPDVPGPGLPGRDVSVSDMPLPDGRLLSGGTTDRDPVLDRLLAGRNGYGWKFRIPYPYVHFFERMHMSAYLRQMEEAKHRFVDDRGISIATQLGERNWIPLVTQSRIEILGEALLEEDLYTVYEVEDVFKNLLYTARMDCHVVRDGRLLKVATGTITHGYAVAENGNRARFIPFDGTIERALRGTGGAP